MKSSEIRKSFIDYFKSQGHTEVQSASLVPANDPTLMFTNAGMNQFKDCFLGADVRAYKRAVTCQKVMRIAGKHNDFENVGMTARHHTFFEMLGNFSFGDYFKPDAIRFGWDFVTKVLGLPESRLWVTIYEKDDEAAKLWADLTTVRKDRIIRLGEADNFWAMGETGPCGPCTEIHVFCGNDEKLQTEEVLKRGDGSFLEIWNLVFMQYDRSLGGKLTPLPKPSVDTGMGLERISAVMQNARSNYDTDLLRPIISTCERLSGFSYEGSRFDAPHHGADTQYLRDVAMRVIADHARAMTFIISDGVTPGSDGRAYILRRIIRRAIRHGRNLGFKDPFLGHAVKTVVETMAGVYPELTERAEFVARVVDAEERKFRETLEGGLSILQKEVEKLSPGQLFGGKAAFVLHDTYGFPLDLTQDALKSYGRSVDVAEFEREMDRQKSRSREDRKSQNLTFSALQVSAAPTVFRGYETTELEARLVQAFPEEGSNRVSVLFEETPFYAESGGQVGDTGIIEFTECSLKVLDTQKVQEKHFVHHAEVVRGTFSNKLVGQKARLAVDAERRNSIRSHHSATHLVHSALRSVLGEHVKQAGSKVDDSVLRFDYTHFEPVTLTQLERIQSMVNEQIRANHAVNTVLMPVEEAMKSGAMALFGEKYGSEVRVVQIGPESKELCGGTHVSRSGDIGVILVHHEGGIAAGVRRIECFAGSAAYRQLLKERAERHALAELLKDDGNHLSEKVEKLLGRLESSERELAAAKQKLASAAVGDLARDIVSTPRGIKIICKKVESADAQTLKSMVDKLRVNLGSGVVALGSLQGEKAMIVAGVTADLTPSVDAGKLIKAAAAVGGGKGGGKADFAQAGGVDPSQLNASLEKIVELLS